MTFELPKNSKKVFEGKRWTVHQWAQKLFDNTEATFETVGRKSSVVILPVTSDGKIILESERQPHFKKEGINLVAGGVEEGEDLYDAAKRETEEEIGMIFKDYYLIQIDNPMPGIIWNRYTFVAKNFEKNIKQNLDAGEQITPKIVSRAELIKMTRNKEFYYTPHIVEHYLITDKLDEFYDMLDHPEKYKVDL